MKELKDYIQVMEKNLGNQDDPMVGIFWYSPKDDDLFGVVSVSINNFSKPNSGGGLITCTELHKKIWAKNYNKYKYKDAPHNFHGDYKDTPRGRIFYDPELNEFIIAVGSWINDYNRNYIVSLIISEFQLEGQVYRVKIMPHWEIGVGWENL